VMGLPAGQCPKTQFKKHSEMVTNKVLESCEMASNETPVERSQNSSWERHPSNLNDLEQFAKE
ncbi:hypothetical protein M9458_035444, partial [Cirrhinus mrigala]